MWFEGGSVLKVQVLNDPHRYRRRGENSRLGLEIGRIGAGVGGRRGRGNRLAGDRWRLRLLYLNLRDRRIAAGDEYASQSGDGDHHHRRA